MNNRRNVSLHQIFLGMQENMKSRLSLNRKVLKHPVAKGDASELEWIDLLSTFLPTRYQVEKAFVIDYNGDISEQIDIVIFDRHFSPFLFKQNGQTYIPVESVYSIVEVKSTLNRSNIEYAMKKVTSVRKLKRTSADIIERGESRPPRKLSHILGGILTIDGRISKTLAKGLLNNSEERFMDFGCSLGGNAFFIDYKSKKHCELSDTKESLIFFFLKVLNSLQSVGTVGPMEINKYAKNIKSFKVN